MRKVAAAAFLMLSAVGLGGCPNPPRVPVARVEAKLDNTPDTPLSTTLSLSYPVARPGPRVTSAEATGHTYLMTATLTVGTPGLTTDAYYLQVFGQPSVYLSDDSAPDPSIVRVGNTSYIDAHTGSVATLLLDAPSVDSPASRSLTFDPRLTQVSAWLARVEVDDRSTRWTVPAGDPNCHATPGGACFDLSTFAAGIATGINGRLTARFDPASSTSADPDPQVRTVGPTALVSYIPNLTPVFDSPTRRARGVGFIYSQTLDARAAPGLPYHNVTLWIPVALIFEADGEGGLLTTLDPFDTGGTSLGQMAGRIAVEVRTPGPGPIEAAVSQEIAQRVLAGLSAALSAPMPANLRLEIAAGFFNMDRRTGPLPADFDVVLVPSRGAPANAPPVFPGLIPAGPMTGVDLVFLQ